MKRDVEYWRRRAGDYLAGYIEAKYDSAAGGPAKVDMGAVHDAFMDYVTDQGEKLSKREREQASAVFRNLSVKVQVLFGEPGGN